jgi:hypothetical protein
MNGYPSSEGGNRDYDAQSGQFVDRSTNPWQVIEPQSGKPVAGWTVDPQTHQVSVNGQPLPP